uniref:Transposase n=1 Tax=Romanomermis culicivorax TaxID=13658 RepID=A0A915HZR0_ROMCU
MKIDMRIKENEVTRFHLVHPAIREYYGGNVQTTRPAIELVSIELIALLGFFGCKGFRQLGIRWTRSLHTKNYSRCKQLGNCPSKSSFSCPIEAFSNQLVTYDSLLNIVQYIFGTYLLKWKTNEQGQGSNNDQQFQKVRKK